MRRHQQLWASATNKISVLYRSRFDKSKSLAIAGVHTTLIAVLTACLSAYMIFVYNTVQQAELKAIEEAEKINSILFLIHQCPYRTVEQVEVFDKDRLVDMTFKIITGSEAPSLPRDVNGRAQKALGIMGALVGQYPFPVYYFKTKEGRFGARSDAEPVSFANLNEVRTWIEAMHETTSPFTSEFIGVPGSLLALLTEFGKSAFVSEQRDIIMKSPLLGPMVSRKLVPGFGRHVTLDGMDPVLVYHDFLNRMAEAMSIVKSTQIYVKRAEALQGGYPSKSRFKIIFALVVAVFGFGVVYPLAASKVKGVFALWLPLVIYVVIGVLAFRVFP
jgi:hypothetical protein